MRSIIKILWMTIAAALLQGAALGASFTATLDRDAITMGEQATLSLKFDDVQPQNAPGLPNINGLQFQYVGPSSAISFINGQTSSSITYTYQVTAQHPGEFVIPPMRARINGQDYTSSQLKLTVNKADAPSSDAINSGNEIAFMKFTVPKNKIYLGEPMVGILELYLRDDVQNLNGFDLTSSPTDGFSGGKLTELPSGQRRRVQVGNRVYTVIPLAIPLTPMRTGSLTLGPFAATVGVILPSQDQGGDPFFRQFFNRGEQKQFSLTTEPADMECLPLPVQNKPANFSGAVGNFTMNVTAGPTNLTVGDPITVRVQIAGHGSLDSLTLPLPETWRDFKAFPPTSKFEQSDQFGFEGTKTFEQIISPQNADVHELPAFSFTFFSPDDGQYHVLNQPALPLVVSAAGANPLPALAAKSAQPESAPAPPDIVPVKENLGTLVSQTTPLISQPVFLSLQSLPVLAFIAAFIWRKRTDHLANNPRLRRQRAVAQMVAEGTTELNQFADANKSDEFFALLFRLLQEQLGERLDCPATAITEADVTRLTRLGATPATLASLHELFQLCNQARYAPVRGTAELNSLTGKFKQATTELQALKK